MEKIKFNPDDDLNQRTLEARRDNLSDESRTYIFFNLRVGMEETIRNIGNAVDEHIEEVFRDDSTD